MSPPKREFVPEPRIWSLKQIAALFGHGEQWLRERLPRMEAAVERQKGLGQLLL